MVDLPEFIQVPVSQFSLHRLHSDLLLLLLLSLFQLVNLSQLLKVVFSMLFRFAAAESLPEGRVVVVFIFFVIVYFVVSNFLKLLVLLQRLLKRTALGQLLRGEIGRLLAIFDKLLLALNRLFGHLINENVHQLFGGWSLFAQAE